MRKQVKQLLRATAALKAASKQRVVAPATKAGARHSASDMQALQAIHDSACELGATCSPGMKGVPYGDPIEYARGETYDIIGACQALMQMAQMLDSEISESNPNESMQLAELVTAALQIVDYIEDELDEIADTLGLPMPPETDEAMEVGEAEDIEGTEMEVDEPEEMPSNGQPMAGKAEMYGGVARADLKDTDFVLPLNRAFPVMTAKDVKDAVASWGRYRGSATFETFKRNLIALAKRKGLADALPQQWKDEIGMKAVAVGGAIKLLDDDDRIGGLAIRFGSAAEPDISTARDYFTKQTDYWINEFGLPRPMLYHHALDPDTSRDPIVGQWTTIKMTEEGIWLEGQLNKAHKYSGAIKELVRRGALKLSSDSAPHLVVRQPGENNTNEVIRWPLITASLTPTPAEPRLGAVHMKSLDRIGRRGARAQAAAARKLTVELDLLELENS